jgi:Fe-S cluster biogenesis protein NfuA
MPKQTEIFKLVDEALNTIRPYLKADGGDIILLEVTPEHIVKVKLQGACHDCPMSFQTLKGGVEMVIKQAVPHITEVIAVD